MNAVDKVLIILAIICFFIFVIALMWKQYVKNLMENKEKIDRRYYEKKDRETKALQRQLRLADIVLNEGLSSDVRAQAFVDFCFDVYLFYHNYRDSDICPPVKLYTDVLGVAENNLNIWTKYYFGRPISSSIADLRKHIVRIIGDGKK